MKFALPTFLAPAPFRVALGKVKDAGADGVRLDLRTELKAADLSDTARREVRHRIREHGLKAGPAVYPTRGAVHEPDRLDARLAGLRAAIDLAGDLGCDTLSLRPFPPSAAEDDEDSGRLTDVLNDLAAAGQRVGVIPCVTPGCDVDRWAEVLAGVSAGVVGVNFDPAAVVAVGGDPAAAFMAVRRFVHTVTARDALAGGGEVPVGRGEVEWERHLAQFDEAGFTGWVACDRTSGPDPFAEATAAVAYLRNVARP